MGPADTGRISTKDDSPLLVSESFWIRWGVPAENCHFHGRTRVFEKDGKEYCTEIPKKKSGTGSFRMEMPCKGFPTQEKTESSASEIPDISDYAGKQEVSV